MTEYTMCKLILAVLGLALATVLAGWDPDEAKEYDEKALVALAEFKEKDPNVQKFIDEAAGYVVIPTVGSGCRIQKSYAIVVLIP